MSQLGVLDCGYWEDLAKWWLAATRVWPIANVWHNWHLGVIVPSHWELCWLLVKTHKAVGEICSLFRGHLIFINFPPQNWEGYYAYSSRIGGKLCLLIGVRTLPLLRSRQNPPIHMPHDWHRFGSW
jgi:hypothetical protein